MKNSIILSLIIWGISSCNNKPKEWQELEYVEGLKCDSLYSALIHYPIKCKSYFEGDTLVVLLSDISWQFITVKIHDRKFKAELSGIPFNMFEEELLLRTQKQQLQIGKAYYAINDTLCANFDFLFQQIEVKTNNVSDWNFRGSICEVIREKCFNPLDKENFMNFDLSTAVHEIGEPLDQYRFNMDTAYVRGFRIEILNYLPREGIDVEVRELTWDVSPISGISDAGRERLTIWYIRNQDRIYLRNDGYYKLSDIWIDETINSFTWLPLHYIEWNEDWQF